MVWVVAAGVRLYVGDAEGDAEGEQGRQIVSMPAIALQVRTL